MDKLDVNGIKIGNRERVFIIAEIGLNHNGNVDLACRMIEKAKQSGADAVKFQTYNTDKFITKSSQYYPIFKNTQLDADAFARLKEEGKNCDICFFSTPFDFESVDLLESLDIPLYKVASCDLTNIPLIKHIASKGKPIAMSTGMGTVEEIRNAIEAAKSVGNCQIALMHCVSNYPVQPGQMNLRTIPWMINSFQKPVGLSDHSEGILMPLIAVGLGACIIEKHFTLDRGMEGPDHALSSDPEEFTEMVRSVRLVEESLGEERKKPVEKTEQIDALRRSLYAARDIPKGTSITQDMISIMRPGTGIPPGELDKLIGKISARDIPGNVLLCWEDVT